MADKPVKCWNCGSDMNIRADGWHQCPKCYATWSRGIDPGVPALSSETVMRNDKHQKIVRVRHPRVPRLKRAP